jgi:stearoyl-CoA desaturase (Delta-9 desaturase)
LAHITVVSVTIYLHRHQAHHALTLHPIASHFFRFWLWLTTGMTTRIWVAIHRKHHAHSDRAEDPHSPQVCGIRRVLLTGTELYRIEARNAVTIDKYGHSTPEDWIERNVYAAHGRMGIVLMLVIDLVLFGPIGLSIWAIQMIWIPFFAAGVVNGVGHYIGYRNFATSDASRNISPWGILVGGEELHNNHHAYIRSARFSSRPWEFDIGWMYIRILEFFRLAHVRTLASMQPNSAHKKHCDTQTLTAIIAHRYDVLMAYSRAMMAATRSELKRLRADGAPRLSEFRLLDPGRDMLTLASSTAPFSLGLEEMREITISPVLHKVYVMRQDLAMLWGHSSTSTSELVQNLENWCVRAETSGIDDLKRFATELRAYA